MTEHLTAPWLFVIDTADYAGNFERELCGYITGRVGECGVGQELGELFVQETKLESFSNVVEEADDHGCHRPATIYPTKGYYNNGLGEHFADKPENYGKALLAYNTSEVATLTEDLTRYARYLRDFEKDKSIRENWTIKRIEKEISATEKRIIKAKRNSKFTKYPAYQSVAISFERKPTLVQITIMKERATKFALLPDK